MLTEYITIYQTSYAKNLIFLNHTNPLIWVFMRCLFALEKISLIVERELVSEAVDADILAVACFLQTELKEFKKQRRVITGPQSQVSL